MDTKDWTWTIERVCPQCGVDAAGVGEQDIPRLLTAYASLWPDVMAGPRARSRPDPDTWSPLEYAAHVRDVCRVFATRTDLMLGQAGPTFTNWDAEGAAVQDDYAGQEPAAVAEDLSVAAADWAGRLAGLSGGQWQRSGIRGDGKVFTVLTLARYGLHEMAHHLHDVGVDRLPQ